MRTTTLIMAVILTIMVAAAAFAGNLDAPAAPGSTNSYKVDDIYNRLNNGTTGTQSTFTGPPSGAIGGTGHTLDDVMGKAPATDNTNGATAGDVLTGKSFWGLTTAGWGLQTGTLACAATATGDAVDTDVLAGKTFSNLSANGISGAMANNGAFGLSCGAANQTVTAGYYSGGTLTGDANLTAANIKSGASIFGVTGSTKVMDTTSGTAAATDILSGKTAFVNGATVTGSIATQTVSNAAVSQPAGYYAAFNLSTVDTDLVSGNILSGKTIFGVTGSTKVMDTTSGTAAAGDILSGKTAFVNGASVTGSIATQTVSNATVSQPAGYYAAFDLSTVDTDLAAANIVSGKTIFGVAGSAAATNTAPVPKTGQTTQYSAGDDGEFQKGATIATRFTDNGNGTVTDNFTGLMWLKDANCIGTATWATALTNIGKSTDTAGTSLNSGKNFSCDSYTAGTFTDWRLPNLRELQSLIDYQHLGPALPADHLFLNVQLDCYWSATTYIGVTTYAWFVALDVAYSKYDPKSNSHHVWAVRGGQ